jgi:diazepam-binding inhibitor (GABA receptor modulating acyl-CoA-binding protein)
MASLQEQFDVAVKEATDVVPSNISNDEKLELYALFKQATVGDVNTCERRPDLAFRP